MPRPVIQTSSAWGNQSTLVEWHEVRNRVAARLRFDEHLSKSSEGFDLFKAAKKGPGSRGGHVIGKTKSGKNIYEKHSVKQCPHYSAADHLHAGHAHLNHGDLDKEGITKDSEHRRLGWAHLDAFKKQDKKTDPSGWGAKKSVKNADLFKGKKKKEAPEFIKHPSARTKTKDKVVKAIHTPFGLEFIEVDS